MNLFDGNTKSAIPASDVFAIHFEHMGKEHRPRRRGLKARSNASLSLTNVRELQPKAASAWSVFFFPNVSKNTCKHPPPNTRYISSAEFSKTAFVKNNPIKKQEVRVSCTSPAFHLTAVRKRELQRDSLFLPG